MAGEEDDAGHAVEVAVPVASSFPVVGIGASAGGLAAFEAFFSGMPADTEPGMAFVLVQHLAPDHESLLSELIGRYTRMQVAQIEDGMEVRPNCVYIIPPGRDLALRNGTLQLREQAAPRGLRLPIDTFFRSLAEDQRERAIGVVLSGTGSDGTLGVRAIKGEGGMVMAQSRESAEFDGMPCSALATGLVDYELPPAEMPARLIAYATHAFGPLPPLVLAGGRGREGALRRVCARLREQTGHDFSQYKPSTIHRRIERRMAVHQIVRVDDYVEYLDRTPTEAEALFRDLLIGVTSFFRDPEAFQALEEQFIPKLFEGKRAGDPVRVWSAGCSTGEEAYSLAILLLERMETLKQSYRVQIFATDLDQRAIAAARVGFYPISVAQDLSPQRLARFFTAEPDGSGYRIHKGIRDLLVFSEHDLIRDPPFGRLDLVCCRNLLIYLGAELQRKVIPLFHYALRPGGSLFLGTSEGVGEFDELFAVVDRRSKLYKRRDALRVARYETVPSMTAAEASLRAAAPGLPSHAKLPLRELTEQALLQLAPASALVNAEGDMLYVHGRTGRYLEPAPGEARVNNVLRMAREGLRSDLTMALRKAAATGELVRAPGLRVKTNGDFTLVNLTVRPVAPAPAAALAAPLYLVLFEEGLEPEAPAPSPGADGAGAEADARVAALTRALRAKDEHLHAANQDMQAANEELKSANEEMQSVNEELQSTNEELETSREEMQSVNEELSTVNAELHTRVVDLSRANNDMTNLLAGTGIATVFVDLRLRILRFTPAAASIINLLPSDVGRPVGHIVSNLVGYDRLVADAQAVLDTLIPTTLEVLSVDGRSFTLRIQPYRTLQNVIEGVVVSFIDITEMVRIREALRAANDAARLAVVVRDARDAVTVQDLEGRILAWNPGAVRMYGWSEAEALEMNIRDRIPPALREEALNRLVALSRAEVLDPYRTQRVAKGGVLVEVSMVATALVDAAGQMYAIATTERADAAGSR